MAEALAFDGDMDDGEVGEVGVLVAALLGGPAEDVECEVRVGLGFEGGVDVGRGEAGFEVVEPGVELFIVRGEGSWVGVGWGWWWRWWREGLGGCGGYGADGVGREEIESEGGGEGAV